MKRWVIAIAVTAVVVGMLPSVTGAFTMSEKVVVANELVAIIRVPAGGFTPQERVDRINERLAYILGFEPLRPGTIYAVPHGNARIIYVGNTPLVTVTPRDAQANNTTVPGLTREWLSRAEDALPEARPSPTSPGAL